MSSPDTSKRSASSRLAPLIVSALLVVVAGCTVQPLYGNAGSAAIPGAISAPGEELAAVSVATVNTRVAQEVRNNLLFLLHGGGTGAPPRYDLTISVSSGETPAASIQVGNDEEPTASNVTITARYTLVETATGRRIATGRRATTASYDVSRQQFSAIRAKRDAENRAAREAAELLRLSVAQDLSRHLSP